MNWINGLIVGFLSSVLSVIAWEIGLKNLYLRIRTYFERRKIWKSVFDYQGKIKIVKSQVTLGKSSFRAPDIFIEQSLSAKLPIKDFSKNNIRELSDLSTNILVIGSVRYNQVARQIQEYFNINYEYIEQTYDSDPTKRILKIVNEFGDEYSSSEDISSIRSDIEVDYGIMFIGNINEKKIYWISGIHGHGTIGVAKYLMTNPREFDFENSKSEHGKSWLFRIVHKKVKDDVQVSYEDIISVDLLNGGVSCSKRNIKVKPTSIVCDFGNVIMFFDRNRTYRKLSTALNVSDVEVKSKMEDSNLLSQLEMGNLTPKSFFSQTLELFSPEDSDISYEVFREVFGDIFWVNKNMLEALKIIKEKGHELILLSNTNEIHFSSIRKNYKDIIDLFEDRLILSYEVKRMKPDKKIFREIEKYSLVDDFERFLYIDDKLENVESAEAVGMKGVLFYKHTQFVYALRKNGIYID